MSSNIPIRRPVQRTVRGTVKDIENATSRAARITARTKALAEGDAKPVAPSKKIAESSAAPTSTSTITTATSSTTTTASMDLAGAKRKRGVLGDISGPNAGKDGKGKDKADNSKTGTTAAPSRTAPRRPLQTTAGTGRVVSGTRAASVRRKFTVASTDDETVEPEPAPPVRRSASVVVERPVASASTSRAASLLTDEEEAARVAKKRHTIIEEQPLEPLEEQVEQEEESQLEADDIAAELQQQEERDWIDLDAPDAEDPLMVSEYVEEVCAYMREIERKTLPEADYLDRHVDLDWHKRAVLLEWMLNVHTSYRCTGETWFIFVNIVDRFLSKRNSVSTSKLQLVGLSCFFIATKFEESVAPSIQNIVELATNQYTAAEILKAEQYVLKTLNWDLSFSGPMSFLRRGSKADDLDATSRTIAKYMLEVGSFDWKLIAVPSSMQAAASLYIGRLALGRTDWNPTLTHYAGYSEEELLPVVDALLCDILAPEEEQAHYLIKKWASRRNMKCSIYMRDWVLTVFHDYVDGSVALHQGNLERIKRRCAKQQQLCEAQNRREEARERLAAKAASMHGK